MGVSGGNSFHASQSRGDIRFSVESLTPDDDRSIASKGHAMSVTGGDRHGIRKVSRDVQLPNIIEAPADYGSVSAQSKAVISARCNGYYVRNSRWDVGLSEGIFTPGNHQPIAAERQGMF